MKGTTMTDLRDRVVVVTGAGRGQGAGEVAALLAAGARVVACDQAWPTAGVDPAVTDLAASDSAVSAGFGDRLLRRELDVADPVAWSALAAELGGTFGAVHGLVNNAGIALRSRLGEVELDAWNRVFAVNTTGPMLGMQALVPLMPPGSAIVNVGSLAALTAHAAVAYTASKWALRGLSRVASMQLGERGIRVNLINPGFIETPMTAAAPDSFRQANIENSALPRSGGVADVVPLVLFLLSEQSSFITGAEIPVDGGQSAHAGAKYIYDVERGAIVR
jgi:3alpha(or 20beta)-hydroxysteroid dehydrogenase